MLKRKRPIDGVLRMAYREAGHAVMATYCRIPFVHFGLSMNSPFRAVSRYSRLNEYCQLTPGKPADWASLEKYLAFLLSGSICEMIQTERHRDLTPHGRNQRRFRKQWYEEVWSEPDHRLDLAYLAFVAWLPSDWPSHVDQERQRLWHETCKKLEYPPLWPAIEDIAQRMLWNSEIIAENDVRELIAPESD